MGIHLVVVANTRFLQWFMFSPLLWPFNLCLPVSRHVSRMCDTISMASSLLAFRLRRILAGGPNGDRRGLNRMERAVRLFCREVITRTTVDDASLYVLDTVAL